MTGAQDWKGHIGRPRIPDYVQPAMVADSEPLSYGIPELLLEGNGRSLHLDCIQEGVL